MAKMLEGCVPGSAGIWVGVESLFRLCLLFACFVTNPVDLAELLSLAHSKAIRHMILAWQMM